MLTIKLAAARTRWTKAEVQFLRTHYSRGMTAWIAERLGRSQAAVLGKAHKLGIYANGKQA